MKEIRTEDAVGHILCHDITQIIKDEKKGVLFKKGHVVKEDDIPLLLSVGKEHLFVWEKKEGILHENEAAEILYRICAGDSLKMHGTDIKEGKIEVVSEIDGVLKIRREALVAVNSLGEMMIASRHGDFPVKRGNKIAGTRIIPLVIEKEKMDAAKEAAGEYPVFDILPYHQNFADEGADLIICTGGMSVDPDDRTPGGIRDTGAEIITYSAPVLPGAMLLVAYLKRNGRQIPVLGLPGCVMYAKRTVFDLILPRIMADDKIKAEEINALGEGGLCLNCPVCTFPNCGFGK